LINLNLKIELLDIKYLQNEEGQKTAVQISYHAWQNLLSVFLKIAIQQEICSVVAQETWENMITEGKKYPVIWHKDEHFP